jgi:hypothetical protein
VGLTSGPGHGQQGKAVATDAVTQTYTLHDMQAGGQAGTQKIQICYEQHGVYRSCQ